jgi:hypothetical protein
MRTSRLLIPVALLGGVLALPSPAADPPTRKELQASQNNLKQIVLASINYADTYNGTMATNITDKAGKPLLSWRVAILPYIEQEQLYKQFKLDEAWDSENNKKLIEKMPKVYAPVRVKAKAGETFYQVFTGENTLFAPKVKSKYPASITDGTSNTGLVFEAGEPVIWTKPADLAFDEKKALPKLGGLFDGELHVGMCDGSIMAIRKDFDEKEMKNLIMPADGNVIDTTKLKK